MGLTAQKPEDAFLKQIAACIHLNRLRAAGQFDAPAEQVISEGRQRPLILAGRLT